MIGVAGLPDLQVEVQPSLDLEALVLYVPERSVRLPPQGVTVCWQIFLRSRGCRSIEFA